MKEICCRLTCTFVRISSSRCNSLPSSSRCHSLIKRSHSTQPAVTVDESEDFSKFAATWWDNTGEMKALHSLNRLRVPFIRDCLLYQGHGQQKTAKPLLNTDILDVGCGVGVLSEPLTRLGANVVGIDMNEQVIQVAESHRGDDEELQNLQYLECPIEDLVEVGQLKFDCIVASEVIEHVSSPQQFIKYCVQLLKPGGSLVVSTINRNTMSYLLAIIVAENIINAAPKGTHDWDKFIQPQELAEWLQQENCFVNKIHGMTYLPVLNKWIWTENTDVNYIFHATKYTE